MDYKNLLNKSQYEAVSSTDKYLRIIAGAGSGKTRVLTYRIAYLIDELKVYPSKILAITFTNKVAKEMKERTLNLLPDYDLSRLQISTFHSFCARFLRFEIENIGFPSQYIIYDEEDQEKLVKTVCEDLGYKRNGEEMKGSLKFICHHKGLGELPGDLPETKDPMKKLMIRVFKEYEKRKNAAKALDFDDLIIYTIKILETFDDIREKYNHRYSHILIDEFQDTDNQQFKLLKLLAGHEASVHVVGDPDQTIYTWRGANQKIILDIGDYFYPMRTVILNENYRSTSSILDAANKLIAFNKERVKKDLFTNNEIGKDVYFKAYDNQDQEAKFICDKIKELHAKGVSYKDIVILYRSNYLSVKIENTLIRNGLPYVIYGGQRFYSRKEVKDCLAYFKLFINPLDDIAFDRIINVPKRGIGTKTMETFRKEASERGMSLMNYAYNLDLNKTELKIGAFTKIKTLADKMILTQRKLEDNYEIYSETLQDFIEDIGYYEYLEEEDADSAQDRIMNIKGLLDDIRNFLKENPESTIVEYLQNVSLLTSQDDMTDNEKVTLMTVHTAKGLEYNYVFIYSFNEGVFPNERSKSENGIEEERRLAYVAITRAKKELFITSNRDYSYVLGRAGEPSMFVKEAGLKTESPFRSGNILFASKPNNNSNILYRFNKNDSNKAGVATKKSGGSNFFDLNKQSGNGISWNVGDKLNHTFFGDGVVKAVEDGNIIVVEFANFGVKKLLGNHKALSKKGD